MTILRNLLKRWFEELDLLFLGITDLEYPKDFALFSKWRSENQHAGLQFLEQNDAVRGKPGKLLPDGQSAIIFGFNYFLDDIGQSSLQVARYAHFKDYHKFMKSQGAKVLEKLRIHLIEEEPALPFKGRVLVDSAPILERALAKKTLQGFIGKNSMFIHPQKGSFILLGEIIVSQSLEVDLKTPVNPEKRSHEGGCGTCRRCQVYCPTGALDKAYKVDANLCLSYWTIEHRGLVPEKFWPYFKDYFFGCDICQTVCPYNRQAAPSQSQLRQELIANLDPFNVARMNQSEYEKWFGGTPLTRAKIGGLRRNALIAMAVTRHPRLDEALFVCKNDSLEIVALTSAQVERWLKSNGVFQC